MAKDLSFVLLLDCYSELLTQRQRDLAELYYNEDFSLSEIAESTGITRQAVRDSLRHSEQTLLQTEEKLGMAKRIIGMRECLESILQHCVENSDEAYTAIEQLARKGLLLL